MARKTLMLDCAACVFAAVMCVMAVDDAIASEPASFDHDGTFELTYKPPGDMRGLWKYDLDTFTKNPGKENRQELKKTVNVAIPSNDVKKLEPPETEADESKAKSVGSYVLNAAPAGGGKTTYTGSVNVSGEADANPKLPGEASSSAFSRLQLQAQLRGNGKWITRTGAYATGRASQKVNSRAFGKDPVDYQLLNLVTGEEITGSFLSIPWSIEEGQWSWENNVFTMDARNGDFHIALDSIFIAQSGLLDLVIVEGQIVTLTDSGVFEGVLDDYSVGDVGPISFDLPNEIEFDWDFFGQNSNLSGPETDWEASLMLYNEGTAENYEVPEPTTLAILAVGGLATFRRRAA
jgi:hypothetical protein